MVYDSQAAWRDKAREDSAKDNRIKSLEREVADYRIRLDIIKSNAVVADSYTTLPSVKAILQLADDASAEKFFKAYRDLEAAAG